MQSHTQTIFPRVNQTIFATTIFSGCVSTKLECVRGLADFKYIITGELLNNLLQLFHLLKYVVQDLLC